MEEAQEKPMDKIACFKKGASLTITGQQYNVCSENLKTNLLVSSNRFGYILYGTESDGLAIIPSAHIDHESQKLIVSSDNDDDEPNVNLDKNSIIYRSYLPGQSVKQTPSLIPYWLSLNADETILAIILLQKDAQASLLLFYDVVQLIQKSDSSLICPAMRLTRDVIGDSIHNFIWNPAMPNLFAFIDGLGSVSTYSIDKQVTNVGKSIADVNNSSICWSPKGKQIVVVKYDGSLELFSENMQSKKKHSSLTINASFPPCISVLWISTPQFLLGFSKSNSSSDQNPFVHIMATYNKEQPPKAQIFYDLFFDVMDVPMNTNLQYFYVQLNQNKNVICGLSKSIKIGVLGSDELTPDSYDIWTFDDHLRADVKGSLKVDSKQLTLTGMALGLNSTISIKEYGKQLPSCPMLLLSNSEGVLQVYYFIHEQFQSICRAPEVIKQIQVGNILGTSTSSALPIVPSQLLTNGSLTTSASTPVALQPKEKTNLINTFGFNQQTVNGSSMNDFSKPMTMNLDTKTISTQQPPIKSVMNNEQSSTPMIDSKKFLQMVDQFQSKLSSLGKSIPKPSTTQNDSTDPLNNLKKMLTDMTTSYQKSMQSIKTMTSEHIESVTKIENARYQLRLSQKENLYHSLKDRELDPWTQSRLDSIKTKYDQLKHNLNVLLQVTHTTIHDTSLLDASDDAENEYFLPDLKISLNTSQTMKQRMQNRICELSHKVTETERDLEKICSALNNDILSSKTFDKTTMSSERPFHTLDAQILAHLQATHKSITQVIVPHAVGINISSTVESLKKQTPIESLKPKTPLIQPSAALQQPNTPSAESESFKNMLRIVRTSIDLFSGVTSPEQLQELSNTIATSPLATTQRSNTTSMPKTPTTTKTTTLIKTPTILKPQQQAAPILQTPAKSITSPVPTISVTPATPATQSLSSNTPLSLVQAKPVVPTLTDQTKSQTSSAANDSAIRSLLNSTVSPQTNVTSVTNQLGTVITPNQVAPMAAFSNSTSLNQTASFPSTSAASTSSAVTVASPSSTVTTSVQSTSPTTKPLISAGLGAFGSKPSLSGSGLNLGSMSASIPFGSSAMAPTTTASTGQLFGGTSATAASIPSPFGSGFSTPSSPAPASTGSPFGGGGGGTTATTTSAPTTGIFGNPSTSTSSPFGTAGNSTVTTAAPTTGFFSTPTTAQASPFGSTTTTSTTGAFGTTATTAAPQAGIFGGTTNPSSSPFGAATSTAASTTGVFGGGGGGFGSSGSTSSPFGGSFTSTPSTSVASPFGSSGFGTTSSAPTNSVFGGFGSTSTAPTSTSTTGGFGISSSASSPTSSTGFGSGPSFGGNFSVFNTQSKSSGSSTGFTFGGFGGASSNTAAPQQTFASFGSPTSATSPPASSPFGGSMFGGSSMTQSTGFGTTGSTFGAPAAQSPTSGSFSAYRK